MKIKNCVLFAFFAVLLVTCGACNKATEPEVDDQTAGTTDTSAANQAIHEDPNDYVWTDAEVIPIILNGNTITENTDGATVNGSTLTISMSGTYSLSGTLTNGQIVVNTTDKAVVRLILNGVNITNSQSAPVYIRNSAKTVIYLPENTANVLTDAKTYVLENAAVNEPNAALYSKSDLTIFGGGSLNVTGNYKDGIASVDGLIIKSGNINVTAADDAIRGKDYLVAKDGSITVNCGGDGLRSDNADDASRGYISIEKGTFDITAKSDGISAETDAIIYGGTFKLVTGGGSGKSVSSGASAKAVKGLVSTSVSGGTFNISSADDAIHSNKYVSIKNGNFTIATAGNGIHADAAVKIGNGNINITKSKEGIESGQITVDNGYINIVSSDDGFNATYGEGGEKNDNSYLHINGGSIYVNTSRGDGLDSNGNIVMSGGTAVIHGPSSSPEVGVDFNGTFNISGGLLMVTGPNSGNMIQATSTSSTQNAVKAVASSQLNASTLFHIQDDSGNTLVTFQPVRTVYYVVFSSSALKDGSTYHIYTGGSSTGTNTGGLYAGGTYSGGTLKKSFTVSSILTTVTF